MKLEEILDKTSKTKSVFTRLYPEKAKLDATRVGPCAGLTMTAKDLFDIEGEVTRAGSRILDDRPAAAQDAPAVAKMRSAGAVLIGSTTMTELAYSGLGLNPHDGTADNPVYPGHIPGGSTSGGAVSVALKLADIALGSDTGGSLRIPAAFCGVTGFKPSQATVSREGTVPLSDGLDSIGPIAKDVSTCALAWQVMAGQEPQSYSPRKNKLVVPENFGLNDLDAEVASGFEALVTDLTVKGWEVERRSFPVMEAYKQLPVWHFSAVESRRSFEDEYQNKADLFDPRVRSRMKRADEVSDAEFDQTVQRRKELISAFNEELGDAMILLPTVAILPPSFKDVEEDVNYDRLNLLALRNTSLANVMDGCSISIPFQNDGNTLGAMLVAVGGKDKDLLSVSLALESDLQP